MNENNDVDERPTARELKRMEKQERIIIKILETWGGFILLFPIVLVILKWLGAF